MKFDGSYSMKMEAAWRVWEKEHPEFTPQTLAVIRGLWEKGELILSYKYFTII